MKKYIAELIGTLILVFMGCGTAMLVGCDSEYGSGYILTALAFGLTVTGMAYCIGNISGCHINPAVSLALYIRGDMNSTQFGFYTISQCLGSIAGTALLAVIFKLGDITDMTGAYGANGIININESIITGLIVEIVLTFIFVLIILGVTSKKSKHGSFVGLIIGLSLTLVHIIGIKLTGTSVNPARSLGPALFAGKGALKYLWIFIVGPFAGAALASIAYKFLETSKV